MKYFNQESNLAHYYLDKLDVGVEIGGSAHNAFNIKNKCINIDKFERLDTEYKLDELKTCGEIMPVDVVAEGDDLPFEDSQLDYVVSSHVLEHFYDPIKTLLEWKRVVIDCGIIFMIIPHKDRTFDSDKQRTSLNELIERHKNPNPPTEDKHWNVWTTEDGLMLCLYLEMDVVAYLDIDDKRGNGFCLVIKVHK